MIRKCIERMVRLFRAKKPKHSVIDARLYKALSLCLKASDLGLVTNLSPAESVARMDQAIAELDQIGRPQRVYRERAGA